MPFRCDQPLWACPSLLARASRGDGCPAPRPRPRPQEQKPAPILASRFTFGIYGRLRSSYISTRDERVPREVSFLPPPRLSRGRTMRGQTFSNTCCIALICTGMYWWFFPSSTKTALFGAIHQRIAPPAPPAPQAPFWHVPLSPSPGLTTTFRNALH